MRRYIQGQDMSELLPPQQMGPEGFDPRKIFPQGFSLDNIDLIQGEYFSELIGLMPLTVGLRTPLQSVSKTS